MTKLLKGQLWRPPEVLREPILLAQLIQSYARAGDLNRGKQLHGILISNGGVPSTFVANHLLNMYCKCGQVDDAVNLFDGMPQRNLVSWTAMVSGFAQNGKFLEALRTFSSMCAAGFKPTQFAFSSAIQASAYCSSLGSGRQMHCLSLKLGFDCELFVASNLADMYSKCGSLIDACRMFDEMPTKDEVAWTAMIDGYAKNGSLEEAILAFREMFREGMVAIDQHVFCSTLSASGGLRAGQFGSGLHSCIVKLGYESEAFIQNAVIDMYSKTGDMESASAVVRMDSKSWNVVSCSSLIDGYIEVDRTKEALRIYVESQRRGIKPNEFTFSSMIKGCAAQAVLEEGSQLHAQVIKCSLIEDPFIASTLIDMYGKCGLLGSSIQMFDETQNLTEIAWNSIVGVLSQHGRGKEAIRAFNTMISRGIIPNHITFVNLLMACSHSGLVEEGLDYFYSMSKTYNVEPREEHYSCIIDMLARAGRLKEAEEFICRMPIKPNAYGWCSLLGACRVRGNKELGESAAENLMKLEPNNSGIHILLSGMYASLGRWEDVKAVRKLLRDSRVKKLPGFSWVEVNNKTHVFGSEDWSHPQQEKIYEKLEELSIRIREAGYVPNTASLSCNLEDSLKERLLLHHSERIAVAFALISMPVTKPIIVKKNLRVCVDCHSAMKLISKVERREIIIRDNARFHHFAPGLCSCGDYW
ncbi:putative pentatricopeptide repeat-containing protein At5g52630 [Typha latifolia]|uniref:putative pentatricopeptide repeat-containing protein At5g52630 n=1 Tax=Typha latifolia TaxID=4733 RepID=UPI003C30C398